MKPWIKRTLAGIAGAAVLFTGLAAWSHRSEHGHRWHAASDADIAQMKARFVERAARHLDLDAAQQQRLAVLADRVQEQRKALLAGSDPRAELQGLVAGPAFDRAKALALLDAKTGAVTANGPNVVNALADFYDSLRPEQQQQLRDMMSRKTSGSHGRG